MAGVCTQDPGLRIQVLCLSYPVNCFIVVIDMKLLDEPAWYCPAHQKPIHREQDASPRVMFSPSETGWHDLCPILTMRMHLGRSGKNTASQY